MQWKESSVIDERLRFVARLIEGEEMTVLCREFGISGKTGDKIYGRDKEHGLEALTDRSRRPVRYANQLPPQIESLTVAFKRENPLGRAQDPRTAHPPPARRGQGASQKHHPCRARPSWPRPAHEAKTPARHRNAAVSGRRAQ